MDDLERQAHNLRDEMERGWRDKQRTDALVEIAESLKAIRAAEEAQSLSLRHIHKDMRELIEAVNSYES